MTEKSLTRKVHGGKLFRIDIRFAETIEDITITGDFFLHPEDFILKIEASLTGIKSNSSSQEILNIINEKLSNIKYELIGVSFEDIVEAITEMTKEGTEKNE